jgi:hypothetical protein
MPTALGRRICVLLALLLALAIVGAASGAGSLYKGKVKAGGTLSFRTTATSVIGFKATPTVLCTSVAGSLIEVHYLPLQTKKPLKNGHFKITYKGAFSTYVTVTGTVKGATASGRLNLRYTKTSGMTIYACSCKSAWTAKKA